MNNNQSLTINKEETMLTGQTRIAQALSKVFEGKNVRYFKQDKDIMFVCKDVVEAVGGVWNPRNFNELISTQRGGVLTLPVETDGGTQNTKCASHRVIIHYLIRSNLEQAKEFSEVVMDIVEEITYGKEVNTPITKLPFTPEEQFNKTLRLQSEQFDILGYSQGYKRANAISLGIKYEQELGYNPLTSLITNDPHAQIPDPSLDPHLGTHAAIMEVAGTPVRITEIAEHYELSTDELNRILRVNNCQEILKSGKSVYYTPIGEGKYYAYAPKVVSKNSPIVGRLRIDGWFFNQPSFKAKLDFWVAEYKSAMTVPSIIEE